MSKPSALHVGGKKAKGRTNKATKTHKRKSMSKKMRHTKKHHKGGTIFGKLTDALFLSRLIRTNESNTNGKKIKQNLQKMHPKYIEGRTISQWRYGVQNVAKQEGIYAHNGKMDKDLILPVSGKVGIGGKLYKVKMSISNPVNKEVKIELREQSYEDIISAMKILRSKWSEYGTDFKKILEELTSRAGLTNIGKGAYAILGWNPIETGKKSDALLNHYFTDILITADPFENYSDEQKKKFKKWFFDKIVGKIKDVQGKNVFNISLNDYATIDGKNIVDLEDTKDTGSTRKITINDYKATLPDSKVYTDTDNDSARVLEQKNFEEYYTGKKSNPNTESKESNGPTRVENKKKSMFSMFGTKTQQ